MSEIRTKMSSDFGVIRMFEIWRFTVLNCHLNKSFPINIAKFDLNVDLISTMTSDIVCDMVSMTVSEVKIL